MEYLKIFENFLKKMLYVNYMSAYFVVYKLHVLVK